MADDFVRPAPETGQFIGKPDLLGWYRSHTSRSADKKRIEDLKVSLYGSAALARGVVVTTNPAGKVMAKLLFADVVRRNGKWQAVSAQENAITISSSS